jgi:hypothetical protein
MQAAPNPGGPRSGTVTIAGKTFSATQGAGACGALDATSQATVFRTGLSFVPFSTYLYSQTVTVQNTSGSVIRGPVYLALIGLPTHVGYPNDSGLLGNQSTTTCFSSQGDYLIPVGGDLQPGQSVPLPLMFFTQRLSGTIQYTTKVLSGMPSR